MHFLSQDNRDLAELFGESTDDQVDKFAAADWEEGPLGAPILAGTRGWVAGPILARWDAGDHVAHLVDVAHAHVGPLGVGVLGFQSVRDMTAGHPA